MPAKRSRATSEIDQSGCANAVHTAIPKGAVPLESILCTGELGQRRFRPPDHEKENRALLALAEALADSPQTVLQTLADTILDACQAGSAGISLLREINGERRFYWPAIAGQWETHIGGGTPRDFGPCGDVLDRNAPLLFHHIARRYAYFQEVTPAVEEALLVPFYVDGNAVGTIWAVSHDDCRKFDAEDLRLMTGLGKFASSAYQVLELLRDITERKLAEEAIKEKEFSARLLSLQDEERRRIARELHDGVGQLLAAMSMNSSRVNRERANLTPGTARCAEENFRLIEQVSADIRTLSYLFHPPLLDEMGLDSALKWYVDGFSERSKIAAKLELPANWRRLPPDHELCLFRIAQECLTNIHRHSGGKTALLRLLCSPGKVRLEVSDDGKGLDHETQSKVASGETAGVGLRGMRERVRQLGGALEIRSNGHGTTVTATMPFTESAHDREEFFSGPSRKRAASQA